MPRLMTSDLQMEKGTAALAHPVLDLMRQRKRDGSRPGQRTDSARLGLAIEGGAMRGVVSGGMLKALEHLGMLDTFDIVYGSSAGAINGAFFLASQAAHGIDIYFEEINNSRFLSLGRSVTRRPVMLLDYLFEEVMVERKVLDWRAVIESPIPLKVVATSLDKIGPRLFEEFRDREHLFAVLRASSSIPLLAGAPVVIDGERFLDALLVEPIPYRSAVRDGCSHVLVLFTRPEGFLNGRPNLVERHVLGRWIASLEPRLRNAYLGQERVYDGQVRLLKTRSAEVKGLPFRPPRRGDPTCFYTLSLPTSARPIRWAEWDRGLLETAADQGFEVVTAAMHGVEKARIPEDVASNV